MTPNSKMTIKRVDQTRMLYKFCANHPGNAHFNSEEERISYWFDRLPVQDLLARNPLHLFMHHFFQHLNNLVQTGKDRRSAVYELK